jgi:hypothetical protein
MRLLWQESRCLGGADGIPFYDVVSGERKVMALDVSDGLLIDVRGIDIGSLRTADCEQGMQTALDRLLEASDSICNTFNNFI